MLAHSFWRKALVTVIAAGGFASFYEVTILDSKFGSHAAPVQPARPVAPGDRLPFTATAYCKGITTTSGVAAQSGVAAADPSLLPGGTVVKLDNSNPRYDGIYTVLDTGPSVQQRQIDLYIWSCNEALEFGRRPVQLTVLRLGWNPHATTPRLLDRIFRPSREEPGPAPLPSRPFPQEPTP
jgi:3D (Asp-Asp-Asp) domain-containing protein